MRAMYLQFSKNLDYNIIPAALKKHKGLEVSGTSDIIGISSLNVSPQDELINRITACEGDLTRFILIVDLSNNKSHAIAIAVMKIKHNPETDIAVLYYDPNEKKVYIFEAGYALLDHINKKGLIIHYDLRFMYEINT